MLQCDVIAGIFFVSISGYEVNLNYSEAFSEPQFFENEISFIFEAKENILSFKAFDENYTLVSVISKEGNTIAAVIMDKTKTFDENCSS